MKNWGIGICESEGDIMLEELGISAGTAVIVLIALYLIVKWAVKNGVKEAYEEISDKETAEKNGNLHKGTEA